MSFSISMDIATAVGVLVVIYQIYKLNKTSRTTFEDSLNKEYRDLVSGIPVDVLMGASFRDMTEEQRRGVRECEVRERIYNYLDLCNEQVHLRKTGRVGKDCWENWRAGIEDNLSPCRSGRPPRPAFTEVWLEVKEKAPNTFSCLERLEKEGFRGDPKRWKWRIRDWIARLRRDAKAAECW